MKNNIVYFISILFIFSACSEPKARRPLSQKTATIYKDAIKQNKLLNDLENKRIKEYIKNDSLTTYITSNKGFWYSYTKKVENLDSTPKVGNVVMINYDLRNLNNEFFYTKEELGVKEYTVDKEDFISALQDGIKLMKKGETITFIIPSYSAFGIVGDGSRIGVNQTLKSTVTLIDIKK